MNHAVDARPVTATRPARAWLRADLPPVTPERRTVLAWLLRLATAGALLGHGAYGVFLQKPGWYGFLAELGFSPASVDAHHLARWVGGVEMALGMLALAAPVPALLLVLCAWKLGTELVWYPLHGLPAWEFVERWSNATAPLALLLVRGIPATPAGWFRLRPAREAREG
jgi:hypothetical protein